MGTIRPGGKHFTKSCSESGTAVMCQLIDAGRYTDSLLLLHIIRFYMPITESKLPIMFEMSAAETISTTIIH